MPLVEIDNGGRRPVYYDSFGEEDAPALFLIAGLGMQRIEVWHDHFCRDLAALGIRAIRFDNRDTRRDNEAPRPYRLRDMAEDLRLFADALLGPRATFHLCGISMGGMIAQTLAIAQPGRTRSLTCIASSLRPTPPDKLFVLRNLMANGLLPPAVTAEEYIARRLETIGNLYRGGAYPVDEDRVAEASRIAFERGPSPRGSRRQFRAIVTSGSRRTALKGLQVPAVILHGDADPLIPFIAGRIIADAIPGSRFVRLPGMGHGLPEGAWTQIIDAMASPLRTGL